MYFMKGYRPVSAYDESKVGSYSKQLTPRLQKDLKIEDLGLGRRIEMAHEGRTKSKST